MHEISKGKNGEHQFIGSVKPTWHGLGYTAPGLMTQDEAIVGAQADFEVVKKPWFSLDDMGIPSIVSKEFFYTQRQDTGAILGSVGAKYHVVQNTDAFKFFDPIIGEGSAVIETAGVLRGGRTFFLLAKTPKPIEIKPDDYVDQYLLFTNTHDGSGAVNVTFTPTRVVCANTLHVAIKGSRNKVAIRHTKNVIAKLSDAHKILCANDKYWAKFKEGCVEMTKRDVNRYKVMEFVAKLFPGKLNKETLKIEVPKRTQKRRIAVVKAFETSPGHELAGDTAWGLYNAATWYIDHDRDLPENSNAFEASLGKSGSDLRQKAWDLALTV